MSTVDDKNRRGDVRALAVAGGVLVGLLAMFAFVVLPDEVSVLLIGLAVTLASLVALLAPRLAWLALAAAWNRFAADDGGLRICRGLTRSYEPFSGLRSVFVDPETGRMVAVRKDGRRVLNAPLATARQSREAQRSVKLFQDAKALGHDASGADALARGDRPVEAWIEHLEGVRSGTGYRVIPTDTASLKRIALDAGKDVEVRAGAAYLLARQSDAEPEVMNEVLHERAPELVVEMAERGTGK